MMRVDDAISYLSLDFQLTKVQLNDIIEKVKDYFGQEYCQTLELKNLVSK